MKKLISLVCLLLLPASGTFAVSTITKDAGTPSGNLTQSFVIQGNGISVTLDTNSALLFPWIGSTAQILQGSSTGISPITIGNGLSFTGGTLSATLTNNGTVSSVAQTVPNWLSVSGSPITTSGTLAITANTANPLPAYNGSALLLLNWGNVSNTPTTLAGYGITDGVSTNGSYSNPPWLTTLAWSKITGTPTTYQGYGITNIPTALPPSGTASGDLSGSYPAPTVTNGAHLVASSVPTLNQSTTGSAATVTGSFGGDVSGTQSAILVTNGAHLVGASVPTLNQNTTGTAGNLNGTPALPNGTTATTQTTGDNSAKLATDAFVSNSIPTTLPPTGAAGGDLSSTYPNPTVTNGSHILNVPWSSITNSPAFLTNNQTITTTGDAYGSGITNIALTVTNAANLNTNSFPASITLQGNATNQAPGGLWKMDSTGSHVDIGGVNMEDPITGSHLYLGGDYSNTESYLQIGGAGGTTNAAIRMEQVNPEANDGQGYNHINSSTGHGFAFGISASQGDSAVWCIEGGGQRMSLSQSGNLALVGTNSAPNFKISSVTNASAIATDSSGNMFATNSGTVTNFSIANDILHIYSVANSTTFPAVTSTLSNAAADSWFGNSTSSAAAPAYNTNSIPVSILPNTVAINNSSTPPTNSVASYNSSGKLISNPDQTFAYTDVTNNFNSPQTITIGAGQNSLTLKCTQLNNGSDFLFLDNNNTAQAFVYYANAGGFFAGQLALTCGTSSTAIGFIANNGSYFEAAQFAPSTGHFLVNTTSDDGVDWVQINGPLKANHIVGGSSTPTISAGSGAGTSPTVAVSGTDLAFDVTVLTGTLPSSSSVVATVTFAVPYTAPPHVTMTAVNATSALLSGATMVYPTSTTTNMTINSGTTGLTGSVTNNWSFHLIQ